MTCVTKPHVENRHSAVSFLCYASNFHLNTQAVFSQFDEWKAKLLLQALRETGEEMARRRQSVKQVLSQHARDKARHGRGGARKPSHGADLLR